MIRNFKEVIGDDKGVTSIKLDTKGKESTKDVMVFLLLLVTNRILKCLVIN